jgi:[ribosomal protein S5]-alanine N-acetyltransferase
MNSQVQGDVNLRPVQKSDGERIQELASDRRVAASCNIPHPLPSGAGPQFTVAAEMAWRAADWYAFSIIHSDLLVGVAALEVEHAFWGISYWLGFEFWGRGLATKAVGLLIVEAREGFKVSELRAKVLSSNLRSRRVLSRNGFSLHSLFSESSLASKFVGRRFCDYRLTLSP